MIKTLKWIYKLGATHRESQILDQLTGAARYHRQQAELAFYRKDEPDNRNNLFRDFIPRLTPQEHDAIATALYDLEKAARSTHQLNKKGME